MATEKITPGTDISNILQNIEKMLSEKLNPITSRLSKIEESLTALQSDVGKVSVLEESCQKQERQYQVLKQELAVTNSENRRLKEELLAQEAYSRRKNVRLYGLQSQNEETLENTVLKTLNQIGINIVSRDIERVHYLGPKNRQEQRMVLMQLHHWKDKQAIMKKKEMLREMHISIQDDRPREIMERRKLLLPIFFKALELYPNFNPKFHGDKMSMGGKLYTTENIHTIQFPELQPERVFSPIRNGIQAYYTKYSPLSNFHPAKFETEGKSFATAEHYFVYKKALHFQDSESASLILKTSDPEKVKQLGKKIQGFQKDEWYKVATEYMYQAMFLKFSQNESLRGFLISTSGNRLIEASAVDKFWGIGQSLRSRDLFNDTKWTGKNRAGTTLERVRQALM